MRGVRVRDRSDGDAVQVEATPKRKRRAAPATYREKLLRRDLVWLQLHRSGLLLADIAAMSGFSVAAVHYGLKRARNYLRKHEDSHA